MTQQLQITRIYSSRAGGIVPVAEQSRAPARVSVLGLLSLLVAATWIYGTWWAGDRLTTRNLMLAGLAHAMANDPDPLGLNRALAPPPTDLAAPAPPNGTEPMLGNEVDEPVAEAGPPGPRRAAPDERGMKIVAGTTWVWLGVMTVAGAWLAFCGGAATAGTTITDPARQRQAMLTAVITLLIAAGVALQLWRDKPPLGLAPAVAYAAFYAFTILGAGLLAVALAPRLTTPVGILGLLGLAAGGLLVWHRMQLGFPAVAPRVAAGLVMFVAVMLGAGRYDRSVRLHKAAVVFVLVAALATLVGLKLADSVHGVRIGEVTFSTYTKAGLATSAYAWVVLAALALRLR